MVVSSRSMGCSLRWMWVVLSCFTLMSGCLSSQDTEVAPQYDKVIGVQKGKVTAHLGIPYAKAPVGALRWADPQPILNWNGTLDATHFGHSCIQYVPVRSPTLRGQPDEDCLNLNIWTPDTPGPHPVMFWVHGGGNVYGSGNELIYDGAKLAETQDVVVVSANYRLGASGFFALPATGSQPAIKGNQAVKDLVAALQWVHVQIGKFGGDPDNVTVFGESAGSINICGLLATPVTKTPTRLLHKAIMESGACDTMEIHTLAQAQAKGMAMLARMGCANASEPLECARNISAEKLRNVGYSGLTASSDFLVTNWIYSFVIDGEFFPEHPFTLLATPQATPTPVIVGTNKDEGSIMALLAIFHPDADGYAKFLERLYPDQNETLEALYPVADYPSSGSAHAAILSDSVMRCPALNFARLYSSAGNPTWLYHFTYQVHGAFNELGKVLLPPNAAQLGTYHSTDTAFVFGIPIFAALNTSTDKAVQYQFQQSWGNFSRTGDPNGSTVAAWQAFEQQRDNYLEINPDFPNRDGFRAPYCDDYWIPRAQERAQALIEGS